MILGQGDKLLFFGDSVTSCFRKSEAHRPYGNGFVSLVRSLLLARFPELDLLVENRGAGGTTVRKAQLRWESDVVAERPDWLAVMLGVNDVVFSLMPSRTTEAVGIAEYETAYRRLLDETKVRIDARLILMEPCTSTPRVDSETAAACSLSTAAIGEVYPDLVTKTEAAYRVPLEEARRTHAYLFDTAAPDGEAWEQSHACLRALLDERGEIVRRLAAEYGALLVRTQAALDEALRHQPPWFWALDRTHPSPAGHGVITRAFLRTIGYGDV